MIIHSLDLNETGQFSLTDLEFKDQGWLEYVKGVAWALQQTGHTLQGWSGVMAGDVPPPADTAVVGLDTSSRRGLVDSAYNERRSQCEAAARLFSVPALRDVSLEQFQVRAKQLDELTRRRARHVITENNRVLAAAKVMECNDPVELGQLMNASHDSLRNDFEVTNEALDTIVTCSRQLEGCYGARMTGAGFGGCAVARRVLA